MWRLQAARSPSTPAVVMIDRPSLGRLGDYERVEGEGAVLCHSEHSHRRLFDFRILLRLMHQRILRLNISRGYLRLKH